METLLNEKDAAKFLSISVEKLSELVKVKAIPAYMIAGEHLRFKKEELRTLRDMLKENAGVQGEERIFNKAFSEVKGLERFKEALCANDIYLIIGIAVFLILIFMFFK